MRAILRIIRGAPSARFVVAMVALAVTAASCSSNESTGQLPSGISQALTVAAAFFPMAEAAGAIGRNCVEVINLTPPGVEPHDLELTPDDVEALVSAEVVLFMGSGFQPALEDAIGDAQGVSLDVFSVVGTVPAPAAEADAGLLVDPHVWLDPGLWARAMPKLAEAMAQAAPNAECDFAANAKNYSEGLSGIDHEFSSALRDCRTDTIVTNHAAFGYLAAAYGLTQEAISGLEPEAEPTADRLADLKTLVQELGVTTIFSEELVSPEVAQTLADEAGVRTAVLSTLEGLTAAEVDAGEDYTSVMRTNLDMLRTALGCS